MSGSPAPTAPPSRASLGRRLRLLMADRRARLGALFLVATVAIVAIGARAAWQAIRATAVLDQAVTRVSTAAGLLRLPISTTLKPTVEPAVEPTIEPTVKPTVEPTLRPSAETPVSDFLG